MHISVKSTVVFKTLNRRADSEGTIVDFLANYTKNTYISPPNSYSYNKIIFKARNTILFIILNRGRLPYIIIIARKKKPISSTFEINTSPLLLTIRKRITSRANIEAPTI